MRLGLLAAARITGPAVVEAAAQVDGVEIAAIAARSLDRAERSAAEWGVARVHPSYDALIVDPDLDAIYVATPASLHRRWTVAALAAGKHVLCEKPLGANADDARAMVDAARAEGRILMEAFHWRYHPLVAQVAGLLESGRVGPVTRVDGRFLLPDGRIPTDDIRWDLALGGGALMDLGCYSLQWVRWVGSVLGLGELTVTAASAICPVPDIDGSLRAEMRWVPPVDHGDGLDSGSGVDASIECSMIGPGESFVADLTIVGRDGTMTVTNPLAPQHGASIEIRTPAGVERLDPDGAGSTTYRWQLEAFRDAVATGTPPVTGGGDAIDTMTLIDACYRAAGLDPRPSLPD